MPRVPHIAGFNPMMQLIHAEDLATAVIRAKNGGARGIVRNKRRRAPCRMAKRAHRLMLRSLDDGATALELNAATTARIRRRTATAVERAATAVSGWAALNALLCARFRRARVTACVRRSRATAALTEWACAAIQLTAAAITDEPAV
jgi:hypothetical protein